MHETGKKLLNLMFRPGERVCVSDSQYGFHSIPLENVFLEKVTLVSPSNKVPIREVNSDDLSLVALNPMKEGYRTDENCSAFRSFLVEMDTSDIPSQRAYISKLKMPYSAVVFSGNKSAHFLVSLDQDLPNEKIYRMFSEWILNIITLADQATKNPSRSIRIPGPLRESGKRQELLEFKGPVKLEDLVNWLKLHPEAKPKEKQQRKITEKPDFEGIKPWVLEKLYYGIKPPNRNSQWFSIAVEWFLTNHNFDDTVEILRPYFSPDKDFREKEWEAAIKSAFKWTNERRK